MNLKRWGDEVKKDNMFLDRLPLNQCYAPYWSYGMICVGCGCCNPKNIKARIKYHKECLKHDKEFKDWCDDPVFKEIQKRNISENIKYHNKKIKELKVSK